MQAASTDSEELQTRLHSGSDVSGNSYVPQALETLDRMQSMVSSNSVVQRAASLGCYKECLIQPDIVKVFDDISHF